MIFGFLVRSGLLVGTVYYTNKVGVWGTPKQSEELYNNIKNEMRPLFQKLEEQLPFEIPALPLTGEIGFLATHYYNDGVKKSFHFVEMLPCYTMQMITKAKTKFEEFQQSPKPKEE